MIRNAVLHLILFALFAAPCLADDFTVEPHDCIAIGRVGTSARSPIHTDAAEALIVAGKWSPPKAGDKLTRPDGTASTWVALKAGANSAFSGRELNGGYADFSIQSDEDRVALLDAAGHSMVYVNGVPRSGDPYSNGYVRLPVRLHRGSNDLLFLCGRGTLKVKLIGLPAGKSFLLDARDATLPDLRVGEKLRTEGGIVVINGTETEARGLEVRTSGQGLSSRTEALPAIPPLGIRKVHIPIDAHAAAESGTVKLNIELTSRQVKSKPDGATVDLRIRKPFETYKRTFTSDIDGSVQYYAVNPALPAPGSKSPPALFLSLHGAGVEAIGQADAYYGKSWGDIVCPTNRRPYGFDWEDWGQMDAMEVLGIAQRSLHTDPARTYLTGHSMGGHGTWHIGVTYPERFAAIGPSAGWISFATYGGGPRALNPSPMQALLLEAGTPGDTLALEHNYAQEGVYILHGDADDNVPVEQAREMRQRLAAFQPDVGYHEQPGAGHWWGNSDEPGAACVDWPAMFDFFAHHELPTSQMVRDVDFTTANPGVSATDRWVTIEQQIKPLAVSSVTIRLDPGKRRFVGKTQNVARVSLDVSSLPTDGMLTVDLDGTKMDALAYPKSFSLSLSHDGSGWHAAGPLPAGEKGPGRSGPFKQAFQHRMVFVYGTAGSTEENAWAMQKARYDAETFWYRGNGSIDVVSDIEFLKAKDKDRSVVIYGNSETNSAYASLVSSSPVNVSRTSVTVGNSSVRGVDLACLFVRPRPGSTVASVAVIGGTGIAGCKLCDRSPYFVSGADFPDYIVYSPDSLAHGAGGIRAAGFFGNDWGLSADMLMQ